MSKIIGIDLGTTNSAVAVLEGKEAKIITNPEGNRTTPSVVSFKNGETQVGEVAKRQAITNPNTISSIKRHMGEADYTVDIEGKEYTPQEISAMILQYIKEYAESYLGEEVTQAVITVPAYFNDSQRQATKDAGKIAGLKVERIVNEPTAAALAYGLDKQDKDEKVLVFDLGGGTFDVSILELGDGVFQVLSTNGDTNLGGDDFDNKIIDWLVAEFKKEHGIDLSTDKMAMQRLKDAAEKAKKDLSGVTSAQISLPFITAGEAGPLHLETTLTRAKFNELTHDLIERTKIPVRNALQDAGLTNADIDEVILVGGSTRIPAVKEAVKKPRKIDLNLTDAQQARRVLDRIVGYKISPVLWKKVKRGLSAGRVQSVAVKLIVDREEEMAGLDAAEHGLSSAYAGFAMLPEYIEEGNDPVVVSGDTPVAEAIPVKKVPAFEEGTPKFTKIEIVCKESKFEALKNAIMKLGITGMTVSHVLGCGIQKGKPEYYRGVQVEANLLPKVQVNIVVSAIPIRKVIDTAKTVLYTGHIGDGKIFVYDVENVVKVRTGEEGFDALQDVE